MNDLQANEAIILNRHNWVVVELKTFPHTCECPQEPYFSDRENFGRKFKERKEQISDHGGTIAWKMVCIEFQSGYGEDFDGTIMQNPMDYRSKIDWARGKSKAAPSNVNARTSKQLDFEDNLKFITYSKPNAVGLPEPDAQRWFRNHDDAGKHFSIENILMVSYNFFKFFNF